MGHDRQDELGRLLSQEKTTKVLNEIETIVKGECRSQHGGYFSGFISVFAEAMVLLGEHGRLVIINDNGGRVVEAIDPRDPR